MQIKLIHMEGNLDMDFLLHEIHSLDQRACTEHQIYSQHLLRVKLIMGLQSNTGPKNILSHHLTSLPGLL